MCECVGHPEWAEDPRFRSNSQRVLNRAELTAKLQDIFGAQPLSYWLAALNRHGIPCAPINTVKQALHSPLSMANGNVLEIEGIPMIASALKLSDSPVEIRRAPPKLGMHTREILAEAGLDFDHYAALDVVR